jgi:hypothetical protein
MELIEQIGSYAGLAAIVGLAVLSALYFSQARDVRRLREVHEGRAPSAATPQLRAAQRAATQRVAPTPGQPVSPVSKAGEPQPTGVTRVGPPAPAAPVASAAGPQSAAAKEAGAKPPTTSEPAATPAAGEEPAEPPAPERAPAAATAGGGVRASSPANAPPRPPAPAPGGNAQGARPIPGPAGPRLPGRPPGAAALRLGQTSATRRVPWYGRLDPRYTVLIAAAALVLGTGGVVAIWALGDGDEGSTERAAEGGDRPSAPLDPSTITVAVLNGTSVAGAADQVANVVESAGYQRGTVDNAAESSAESAVLFAEGAKPAARQVGRELDISQLELIDSETEELVGTADVSVVVGADRAE